MILVDAGPLVAGVNHSDRWYEPCVATSKTLRGQLLTVWPLTEATFLVRRSVVAQSEILRISEEGQVKFEN